jgi:hypothetical protein
MGLEGRCLVLGLERGIGECVVGDKSIGQGGSSTGDAGSVFVVSERGEVDGLVVGHVREL